MQSLVLSWSEHRNANWYASKLIQTVNIIYGLIVIISHRLTSAYKQLIKHLWSCIIVSYCKTVRVNSGS